MKVIQLYMCETCGKASTSRTEIAQCEASHWNLTPAEYHRYKYLQKSVANIHDLMNGYEGPILLDLFHSYDQLSNQLKEFEKEHGINQGGDSDVSV